jgi:AbrB family looped-hinge helix DNA binding protein
MHAMSHVMKVSSNGQVSIPAAARARWNTKRVVVVDLGDRILMRPMPDDPVAAMRGKYRGRGPGSDEYRRQLRREEEEIERRRLGP